MPSAPAASTDADAAALPAPLRALAARGTRRSYRRGTLLIEEGSSGDTLYLLLHGRVRAFSANERHREVTYGVYGPGEYFGEMSLDGGPRSASVITLQPTACVLVTRPTLLQHIGEHPEFALELLTRVIRRARLATASARSMALLDVYGRVVQVLEGLAQAAPDGTRVVAERITHAELASRAGCSREMVSRLMKDLERGGYVRRLPAGGLELARTLPRDW